MFKQLMFVSFLLVLIISNKLIETAAVVPVGPIIVRKERLGTGIHGLVASPTAGNLGNGAPGGNGGTGLAGVSGTPGQTGQNGGPGGINYNFILFYNK
jgi:hypothetical protein